MSVFGYPYDLNQSAANPFYDDPQAMQKMAPLQSEIDYFKSNIFSLMEVTGTLENKTLTEIISLICSEGYHHVWPELMQLSNQFLLKNDPVFSNTVYSMIHKITKRYRYSSRSNALFLEIIDCISNLGKTLISDFKSYTNMLSGNLNAQERCVVLRNLHLLNKINYSLTCQVFY